MAKMTPTVRGEVLVYQRDQHEQVLTVGTTDWYAWLETASSFAFVSETGSFTARRERSGHGRGDWYWRAYRKQQGKLLSRYLGKSETLTQDRLNTVAQALTQPPVTASNTVTPDTEQETALPALHPLLATKLHVPRPRAQLVPRSHLIERLQQGMEHPLTLVSAPAGFGKTTLLAQWLAESAAPAAWLSLEPEDNDPVRFLTYLIAALQMMDARLGTTPLTLLRLTPPPPPETVVTFLANDLMHWVARDVALVLDDYHVITAEPIHRALTYMVEHLPPQLHLILATRADPPLPLARLRARRQLCELRASELRFETAEISAFLQMVMGLDLPAETIAILERRTEGWIVGLQLATLSLRDRADVRRFLAAFSGSHRFVLEYLSEEVFSRQSAPVQSFLLHTCILERLSGPLCDAVTGHEESQAMLERLEHANLFVVSLDDERRWYRYHHLFAEMLKSRLEQTQPTVVAALHQRASTWYEQQDLFAEAVQHALAAPDLERAARLIEQCAVSMLGWGQTHTLLGWLNALPAAFVQAHPFLCLHHAAALYMTNRLEEAEARLAETEGSVQAATPSEQVHSILGALAVIRAVIAYSRGDLVHMVALSRQALSLLPETEGSWRAAARVYTAHSYLVSGDVTPESERRVRASLAAARVPESPLVLLLGGLINLAQLLVLQGRLREAAASYEEVVQLTAGHEVLQVTTSGLAYYFGLGDLLREWNKLDEAERSLTQGMELLRGPLAAFADNVALGYLSLARIEQARGEYSQARATLDAFTQRAQEEHYAPHLVTRGAAMRAQVELVEGNLAAAIGWLEESDLSSADEDLSYLREQEYLTLARVRIAQGRDDPWGPFLQEALSLLERLRTAAESKARRGSVIEILILQALTLDAQGKRITALSTLERVLTLAEPQGYMRLFVDEGAPMARLLAQLQLTRPAAQAYLQALRAACHAQEQLCIAGTTGLSKEVSPRPQHALVDPLSEREVEVLRLIALGASNAEIAERLVVATSTVKYHVKNILAKLAVANRTQAAARARELGLL